MIDGGEKHNEWLNQEPWLNLELQSPHVIKRHSKQRSVRGNKRQTIYQKNHKFLHQVSSSLLMWSQNLYLNNFLEFFRIILLPLVNK